MMSYAFSSKSVNCDPAVDHGAAAGAAFAAGDYAPALAGLRGVLQAGWSRLAHQNDHLITVDDVLHERLFLRMRAIVHHGGSGTTRAAARAGKPALIVPFSGDQLLCGRWLVAVGVGVPPIGTEKLTAERLADALRTLTQNSAMRQRAADLGTALRAKDGLATARDLIQGYVTRQLEVGNAKRTLL